MSISIGVVTGCNLSLGSKLKNLKHYNIDRSSKAEDAVSFNFTPHTGFKAFLTGVKTFIFTRRHQKNHETGCLLAQERRVAQSPAKGLADLNRHHEGVGDDPMYILAFYYT